MRNARLFSRVAPVPLVALLVSPAEAQSTDTATRQAMVVEAQAAKVPMLQPYVPERFEVADGTEHTSWRQPVHAYFRRLPEGWKLVGLERLPEGPVTTQARR